MKDNNLGSIEFSQSDISAILCALPLVKQLETDSPAQTLINTARCESAGKKLIEHSASFSADEVRVISCAITAALEVISGGEMSDLFDIDDEWKRELSQHFFALNRLDPIFDGFVDEIQRRQRKPRR